MRPKGVVGSGQPTRGNNLCGVYIRGLQSIDTSWPVQPQSRFEGLHAKLSRVGCKPSVFLKHGPVTPELLSPKWVCQLSTSLGGFTHYTRRSAIGPGREMRKSPINQGQSSGRASKVGRNTNTGNTPPKGQAVQTLAVMCEVWGKPTPLEFGEEQSPEFRLEGLKGVNERFLRGFAPPQSADNTNDNCCNDLGSCAVSDQFPNGSESDYAPITQRVTQQLANTHEARAGPEEDPS